MYISRWLDVQRTGLLAALGAGRDTVLDAVRGNRRGIEDNLHDMFAYRKPELAFVAVPGQRAPAGVPQLVLHHDRLAAGEHPVEQQLADEQPRPAPPGLPVAQRRRADLEAALTQPVLDPVQGQPTGLDRGTQRMREPARGHRASRSQLG